MVIAEIEWIASCRREGRLSRDRLIMDAITKARETYSINRKIDRTCVERTLIYSRQMAIYRAPE